MTDIITTVNLCKSFNDKEVLRGVNIKIEKGQIYGLIGPNGAGKTTTILLLNGFYRPTSGDIYIAGVDVTKDEIQHKNSLGYLPDNIGFYEEMTARQNLDFFASLYNLGKNEIQKRVEELLEYISLKEAADKPVKTFSKGMSQRLGLAKALIHEPEILIMDEPQSGLDMEGIDLLRRLVKRLAREGKTVLFSSHYLSEIFQLCTSIGLMYKGELIYQGDMESFFTRINGEYKKYVVKVKDVKISSINYEDVQILESNLDGFILISRKSQEELSRLFGVDKDSIMSIEATNEELLLHYFYQYHGER